MHPGSAPWHSVPAELRRLDHWVLWRSEQRSSKATKVPYQSHSGRAKADAPGTWNSFDRVVSLWSEPSKARPFDGIGFFFSEDDPYTGLDLDNALTGDGSLKPWAREIIDLLPPNAYVEISPSGKGLHAIVVGKKPGRRCRKKVHDGGFEIYDRKRYFTITGVLFESERSELVEAQEHLNRITNRVFGAQVSGAQDLKHSEPPSAPDTDSDLIEKMFRSKSGPRIRALFEGSIGTLASESEADLALCSHLYYWTDGDRARVDRLFRQSRLMRPKWDREGYREATLDKASQNQNLRASKRRAQSKPVHRPKKLKPFSEVAQADRPRQVNTHFANAWRLSQHFRHQLCFVEELGFLVYDGQRWRASESEANRVAAQLSRVIEDEIIELTQESAKISDPDARKTLEDKRRKLARWQHTCESASNLKSSLKLAQPLLRVELEQFDQDPLKLNVQNGTLDLSDGSLSPHRPEDLLARVAPVDYRPEAQAPHWCQFIEQVAQGSPELVRYLQTALGYSITGLVREQCLFFAFGQGQNGKSTMLDAIRATLGPDYVTKAAPNLLINKPGESSQGFEVADLKGARLVFCQEAAHGKVFDVQRLKELTGETSLKARRLYRDWFEFDVTFKIWLAANDRPRADDSSLAFWRRLHLIPFSGTIEDPIRDFGDCLADEREGILAWLVDGARHYLDHGLEVPEEVRQATDSYRRESDSLGQFIDECCTIGKNLEVPAEEFRQSYRNFAEEAGLRPLSLRRIKSELLRRGFEQPPRRSSGFVYQGLEICDDRRPGIRLSSRY